MDFDKFFAYAQNLVGVEHTVLHCRILCHSYLIVSSYYTQDTPVRFGYSGDEPLCVDNLRQLLSLLRSNSQLDTFSAAMLIEWVVCFLCRLLIPSLFRISLLFRLGNSYPNFYREEPGCRFTNTS